MESWFAPSLTPVFSLGNQWYQQQDQCRDVHGRDFPDESIIDLAILVGESVPLRLDRAPRYFRMGVAKLRRHFPCGFADDLHLSFDRRAQEQVSVVVRLCSPRDELRYGLGRAEHIEKVRRIACGVGSAA